MTTVAGNNSGNSISLEHLEQNHNQRRDPNDPIFRNYPRNDPAPQYDETINNNNSNNTNSNETEEGANMIDTIIKQPHDLIREHIKRNYDQPRRGRSQPPRAVTCSALLIGTLSLITLALEYFNNDIHLAPHHYLHQPVNEIDFTDNANTNEIINFNTGRTLFVSKHVLQASCVNIFCSMIALLSVQLKRYGSVQLSCLVSLIASVSSLLNLALIQMALLVLLALTQSTNHDLLNLACAQCVLGGMLTMLTFYHFLSTHKFLKQMNKRVTATVQTSNTNSTLPSRS